MTARIADNQSGNAESRRLNLGVAIRRNGRSAVQAFGTATAAWRSAPDFLIIGAKRTGSTSMYRYLEQHPNVASLFPTARFPLMRENQKGVHYFDSNAHRSTHWYRGHFLTRRLRNDRKLIAGEASPYYLYHPLSAQRAARLVPAAKIIVLLRDPIERTFSHWSEQRRNGVEPLDFAAALAAEPTRTHDAESSLIAGRTRYSFAHEQQTYAAQSKYTTSLARWFSHFPSEAILVLRSEDFYRDTQHAFDRVTDHLGLARFVLRDTTPWNPAPKLPIDEATRSELERYFAEDRAAVLRLTGVEWP